MSDEVHLFVTERIENPNPEDRLWPRILNVIYTHGGSATLSICESGTQNWSADASPVYDCLRDVREKELFRSIQLLQRAGLITHEVHQNDGFDFFMLKLTERGFEVAHERELSDRQANTNQGLAFFTLILMLATIIQSSATALQVGNLNNKIILLLSILSITVALVFYQSKPRFWVRSIIGK